MKVKNILLGSALVALATAGGTALAAPTINFDNAGANGGTVSYDGDGGVLTGSDIVFTSISFSGGTAPAESSLTCGGCMLNFTTGNNIIEGDETSDYQFGAGGTFVLTGDALDSSNTVIADGILLTGEFTGRPTAAPQNVDPSTPPGSVNVTGFGLDTKHEELLAYFGIDPDTSFIFSSTNIALGTTSFDMDTGAFEGTVNNADIVNSGTPPVAVPEPGEIGLLGFGLALLLTGIGLRRSRSV
ncbi:PEP-CTERM sorting domain-containing protein [Salinisphaera orenii]|uniref:PEP-CTERM protein-sorting domain-containing protein n=1 Tax=Salinisphaera orenii YIM 95161 TaxID=1051139 RepID=A0A423Q0E3_9GAMM|nr:PEP-CTERM sorting domain-containing protein [Salinisphaera halophila]ROO31387.1 hypothetical protein SAHL_06520 [Salinisphaera halophila YIM 95161]